MSGLVLAVRDTKNSKTSHLSSKRLQLRRAHFMQWGKEYGWPCGMRPSFHLGVSMGESHGAFCGVQSCPSAVQEESGSHFYRLSVRLASC